MDRQTRIQERRKAVSEAVIDEISRVNAAIQQGSYAHVRTFNGDYRLRGVNPTTFDYYTDGNGGFGQTWSGCNDSEWARIMHQLNLPRHPLFRNFSYRYYEK